MDVATLIGEPNNRLRSSRTDIGIVTVRRGMYRYLCFHGITALGIKFEAIYIIGATESPTLDPIGGTTDPLPDQLVYEFVFLVSSIILEYHTLCLVFYTAYKIK